MQIVALEFTDLKDDLILMPPMGYLDFLGMMESATLVITDSGGVQEETTYLGVPCLTARSNTERPITLKMGTNQLVPSNRIALLHAAREILQERQRYQNLVPPPLWDGAAAGRIVDGLRNKVSMSPNEMSIEKQ
jgi:UDP-N-acetylglucosamine 2-epimerase (non-hydrolysing)